MDTATNWMFLATEETEDAVVETELEYVAPARVISWITDGFVAPDSRAVEEALSL